MLKKTLLLFTLSSAFLTAQTISGVTYTVNNNSFQIPAYNFNGTIYIAVEKIADALELVSTVSINSEKIEIDFPDNVLSFTSRNPFATIYSKETNQSISHQLKKSSHLMDKLIFVPIIEAVNLFSLASHRAIIILSPNKISLVDEIPGVNSILHIEINESDDDTYLYLKTKDRMNLNVEKTAERTFTLRIKNSNVISKEFSDIGPKGLIEDILIYNDRGDVEIYLKNVSENVAVEILNSAHKDEIKIHLFERIDSDWYERESEHFKIVYRKNHAYLVNKILSDAENALRPLMSLFDYKPKEKIIINTYDVNDFGFGSITTVPQDFIRLEIEPLEPGYEIVPYNDRIQWLLSHELVHIVVNDHSTGVEAFLRKIFGKVPPEKNQPTTIFYSLLTNFKRYTPRWYQESFAVFIETWFSGGYGRLLGSFDEMYFRTIMVKSKNFYSQVEIETIGSHNSMLVETLSYIYGARFVSYLSIVYGYENLIKWIKVEQDDSYPGFQNKFETVFNRDFDEAWEDFINHEKEFQSKNLEVLNKSETTQVKRIGYQNFGWVTQPHFDPLTQNVFFGYHKSHQLASILKLDLRSEAGENIESLPTPSMIQVASTAFDPGSGLFFFTTNNNLLFRDIWVLDTQSGEKKLLFENYRVGDLSISPGTRDLWGVEVNGGIKTLVVMPYPYNKVSQIASFEAGDDIFNLAVNQTGDKLAAVLHRSNGLQSIILTDVKKLLSGGNFEFNTLTRSGSPENPSWSEDGKFLYWNAFTNGVSNIYRYSFESLDIKAISHCLTGLVKPIEITHDSLLAFEYTTEGFIPVMLLNQPADYLPAINYMGQEVLNKNPEVMKWVLPDSYETSDPFKYTREKEYNALTNLNIHSFVPVVSGFQNQVVFGFFTHIGDPLLIHDFSLEFGVSPLKETPSYPQFHLKFKYDFKQFLFLEVSYNGSDFFDLFNDRKRSMLGESYRLGHNHFWIYDNPHKIKQSSTLTVYRSVEFINDNLIRVSQPDFSVLATNLNSKNLRRSIGSSDYEFGTNFDYTLTLYGTNFDSAEIAVNTYAEFSDFSTWIADHNVLHVKFAGGYLWDNEQLIQARFYFGGFGNRGFDNDEIKQFRKVFRFPGIPIYSMMTEKFGKILFENAFPPIRFSNIEFANQLLNHVDFSVYTQGLLTRSDIGDYWVDVGAQMDLKLKHWYNLESTLSAGIAKAWSDKINDWEWFISFKLLKD